MKAITFSVALVCITATSTKAQQDPNKQERWTISVSGGAAIPVGKFGKKDVWDSTSVFAKVGPVLEVSGSYRISSHWSLSAIVAGQQHQIDAQAVSRQMSEADTSPQDRYAYTSGKWQPGRVLAGVTWSNPIGKRNHFNATASALVGALWVNVPQRSLFELSFDTSGTYFAEGESIYFRNCLKWQFAYQVRVGLQYDFGRRYFLQADLDYAGSILHIQGRPQILASHEYPPRPITLVALSGPPPPMPVAVFPSSYQQPMATLNVSLGIGIRIWEFNVPGNQADQTDSRTR